MPILELSEKQVVELVKQLPPGPAILKECQREATMTITIEFPPATLERLRTEADAAGKDIETFVREAVEQQLARRQKTFAELLRPMHAAVEASGMSEQEVDELLESELKAARAERRAQRP